MHCDTRELNNLQTYFNKKNSEVAAFIGISTSTFVNLKYNRYRWKTEYIKKLCTFFNKQYSDLFINPGF